MTTDTSFVFIILFFSCIIRDIKIHKVHNGNLFLRAIFSTSRSLFFELTSAEEQLSENFALERSKLKLDIISS